MILRNKLTLLSPIPLLLGLTLACESANDPSDGSASSADGTSDGASSDTARSSGTSSTKTGSSSNSNSGSEDAQDEDSAVSSSVGGSRAATTRASSNSAQGGSGSTTARTTSTKTTGSTSSTTGSSSTGTKTTGTTGSTGTKTTGTTGSSGTGGTTTGSTGTNAAGTGSTSTTTTGTGSSSTTGSKTGGSTSTSTGGGTTAATGTAGPRVDNPYEGVKGYINPEWKSKADAESGGDKVSNTPTGVWMDRIAAIDGTGSSASMGMRDHLEEALVQGAGYIQFVIYNLPGRDCAALSSNGELKADEIERYKTEYIDVIAAIEKDPKYSSLRIINIIEIDSLPNLVTNTGSSKTATPQCDTMKSNGNYEKGVAYALGELYKAGNTYNYIDAGHHGWIGWETNFNDSAALFAKVAKSAEGGVDTVTGFITNTANYSALEEPFIKITEQTRLSKWIDYNQYVDEKSFATAFRTKLVSLGFNSSIGMLIDTSRNGWGGPDRPTAASTATDPDKQIDESRIDRRYHLGNWCNQAGAGLGERPKVVGSGGIDAYVWIKPPGESDGASQFVENDQGKGVDGMCDPTYGGNARNNNNKSGALGDAPLSGAWFSAQFQELMANAYPPL